MKLQSQTTFAHVLSLKTSPSWNHSYNFTVMTSVVGERIHLFFVLYLFVWEFLCLTGHLLIYYGFWFFMLMCGFGGVCVCPVLFLFILFSAIYFSKDRKKAWIC